MNKHTHSILIFCLVVVPVLASGCGAVTAVPSPTGTPVPSQTATETVTATFFPTETLIPTATSTREPPSPTPTLILGWSIYFRHDFEENYWKPGRHSYRIIVNCLDNLGNFDRSHSFTIDENAQFYEWGIVEFVYDRTLWDMDGYNLISSVVNPLNKTRISIGYGYLTLERATQTAIECQARAIIDGELKVKLLPTEPSPTYIDLYPHLKR